MEPKLIVNREVQVPAPFDSDLAYVSLRTKTNDPSDGYTLEVRAHFQPQVITVDADGTDIEVLCEIKQAAVRLHFENCYGEVSSSHSSYSSGVNDHKITKRREKKISKAKRGKLGGEAEISSENQATFLSGSAGAAAGYEYSNEETSSEEETEEQSRVRVISESLLHIGRHDSEQPLNGVMLEDLTWVDVKPTTSNERSGVVARLSVRENWMKLTQAKPLSFATQMGKTLVKIVSSQRPEDLFKKRAFEALLRHLVQKRLQDKNEKDEAVLAVHAVVVSPLSPEEGRAIYSTTPRLRLNVPSSPLNRLLRAEPSDALSVLTDEGVAPSVVRSVERTSPVKNKIPARRWSVPQCNPDETLTVLEFISESELDVTVFSDSLERLVPYLPEIDENHELLTGRISYEFANGIQRLVDMNCKPGNPFVSERQFLSSLRLIQKNRDQSWRANQKYDHVDTEHSLRRLASDQLWFPIVRQAIQSDPNVSARELAQAVADRQGKHWAASSLSRYGSSLRVWAYWIDPLLATASAQDDSLRYLEHGTKGHWGGRTKFTRARIQNAKELRKKGLTFSEIVDEIEVSYNGFKNWVDRTEGETREFWGLIPHKSRRKRK